METTQENNASANTSLGWRGWFALVAMLITFGPMLFFYFRQQWGRPEYQAFPVVIAAMIVLLWMRIGEAPRVNRWSSLVFVVSGLAFVTGIAMLCLSYYVFSPWLAMAAFVVTSFAAALKLWQYLKVSGLWAIWAAQFLLLPPPLDRDQMLIESMQLFSSRLTSMVLDSLGVLHLMQGNALRFADREFFVDEACSGIVSLISILSIVAICSIWRRYRIGATTLLLFCGGVWAVLMNTVRLTAIAVAWSFYGVDLAEGVPHTMLGIGLFALSMGVLFLMAKFAAYWFDPIVFISDREHQGSATQRVLVKFWNRWIANEEEPDSVVDDAEGSPKETRLFAHGLSTRGLSTRLFAMHSVLGPPAMTIACVIGVGMAVTFISFENKNAQRIESAMTQAMKINEGYSIPATELQQVGFSNERRNLFRWDRWGQHSRTFQFSAADNTQYTVSCDFMFGPHWHDLRKCYRGTGWKIYQQSVVYESDLGDSEKLAGREISDSLIPEWTVERFHIKRSDSNQKGYVAYAAFRADGEPFNRPRGDGVFSNFWAHLVQGRDRAEQADYFQVQVSTISAAELSDEQKLEAERLLAAALKQFRSTIALNENGSSQSIAMANDN